MCVCVCVFVCVCWIYSMLCLCSVGNNKCWDAHKIKNYMEVRCDGTSLKQGSMSVENYVISS